MSEVAGGPSLRERPKRHEEEGGPVEHPREDAGSPSGDPSVSRQEEHLREDAGLNDREQREDEDDKGLIDKAKDKLRGQ